MIRFANPFFLAGLAAVAVPILIHLLTRDRVRRVAFSSLRFFANASRHVLRRKRFSETLLILLRALACALLALLFARPSWVRRDGDRGAGHVTASRARILLVDVSASMRRVTDRVGLQETLAGALSELRPGEDAAGLIVFDRFATVLHPLSMDLGSVRAASESVEPGFGATDIVAGLRRADELLASTRAEVREILLVSDLQRSGAERLRESWRLSPGVLLRVHALTPAPDQPNLAIVDADCPQSLADDGIARTVSVRVAALGRQGAAGVPVTLRLDGEETARQSLHVQPGRPVAVRFRHVFTKPGDNRVEVRLETADLCEADNTVRFNVRVLPRIPVLLLHGRDTAVAGASMLVFLKAALAPAEDGPFAVRALPLSAVSAGEIRAAAVVVLADAPGSASPAVLAELQALPARGGGILVLPGRSVTPTVFNEAYGEWMPCRLRAVVTTGEESATARGMGLTKVDYSHPVFEVFLHPHHGDFAGVRFRRYWEITGSQMSTVLARFEDGRPAMLERSLGKGLVVVWLGPPDPEWGNLHLRAIFLPLLHQTVRHLALRTEERTAYAVGEVFPAHPEGRLFDPDGNASAADSVTAQAPGFYRLETGAGAALTLAVNTPFAETDAGVLTPEELASALRATGEDPEAAHAGAAVPGEGSERGFWRYVLVVLILVSLTELYVGNRTLRH
ncbi:MAG: BatA and WFA domain-containing protein [Lentisphaeria bacterium]|nr:BatA and WFA domain-containing protein [Lentisphaeria bacterium]